MQVSSTSLALTPWQMGENYQSGQYYFASPPGANANSTLTANLMRVYPWVFPKAMTLAVIGAEVSVIGDVGSVLRLGIYASDPITGLPNALAIDCGTIPGDAVNISDLVCGYNITPGVWWLGGAVQLATTTMPTVRQPGTGSQIPIRLGTATPAAGTAGTGYTMSGVTGALPASFVINGITTSTPRIHFKVT